MEFRNLHACGRVRKVVVQDNCNPRICAPSECHHEFRHHIGTANRGIFRRILGALSPMKRSISSSASIPVNRFYKDAKQLVVRMTGVDEIDLRLAIFTEIEYLPKLHFTKDLLRVSSDNIRKLYLDCALDSLGHAMDVDLILPRLSTLRLSLRIVFPSSQPHKLISPIKNFLVNNHLSITDLELYFSHTVNPANFVQNFPTFPLLSRLLLAFPILDPSKQHLQNLTKFISQHELQLSALDLYVKKNPFHFQNSIPVPTMFEIGATSVLVGFPKLADLTLNMYPMWISGINNKQYIGRYQSTLESLQLQTCVLTFTDLEELFFHTNFSRLRCLALTLTCLSPRHLSLFADTLPGLKHLLFHVTLHVTSNPHADTQQAAPLPPVGIGSHINPRALLLTLSPVLPRCSSRIEYFVPMESHVHYTTLESASQRHIGARQEGIGVSAPQRSFLLRGRP